MNGGHARDAPGRHRPGTLARFAMQVLWPGFLGAAVASGALFSLIDPRDVMIVEGALNGDRVAGYTLGFLLLWVLFSGSCALSWMLVRTEQKPADSA